ASGLGSRRAAAANAAAATAKTTGTHVTCAERRASAELLHLRDGRLHRPRPVSRAVREPVPPQLPGAVSRLRTRHRVVARQPARADGRLPARLRCAPAADDAGTALPALSARGPRVLDLLRHVAPGRCAL